MFLETLLTHWGYIVECASDGEEARARLASSDSAFDVAIVDQTMPNLLGTQLLAWAKEAGLSTPMILCTGYSDDLDEAQALAHGAASMLRKPVETGLLRSLLNRYAPRVDDSARQSR
ncbi:MAG: response regulator [Gammaproteobacteria bacterium]|nr:response regulator [Gammaproteobacteria bacterium]